ncbi:filamentous hemagglutinin N-terminal domain-containing protein [Denitratisoma sp. agr-D3]
MKPVHPLHRRQIRSRLRLLPLALATCFGSAAQGGGVDFNVVAGSATYSQNGNVTTVVNSNGAIINWGALSVLKGETLIFDQAAGSSVLNRVVGMMVNGKLVVDPTVIAGTISSKGNVWIVNSAGIMVGAGAKIDVGSFVASTLNISNENFLAGKLLFDATPGAGTVRNEGTITTPSGGSVYLIAPKVENLGTIVTPNGETILAAGQTVSLVDTGTPGVKVEITGSEGSATNLGTILAEAGRIGMAGVLVRNSGTLNASSVVKEGGRVFLKASQDAYVDGNGRIVTTGTKGGQVEVLGNRVTVTDAATIDASGSTGGGTVLIGGDYQGKNAAIQNAENTYFGAGATIKADATDNGDGGKVILWSNDTTTAWGKVSVQGGANGGDGGFVETSGHKTLYASGMRVNALAAKGERGTWLLDPTDVTIIHSGTASYAGSVLTDSDINHALYGANIVYQADNLTINAGVDIGTYRDADSSPSSLTFNVVNNIVFGDGADTSRITFMSSKGNLTLDLNAGGSITTTANTDLYFGSDSALNYRTNVNVLGGKTWNNFGSVSLGGKAQIRLWDSNPIPSTNPQAATFNNKSTGTFTSNDRSGFAIYSESTGDSGVFNNDGTVIIKSSTAFEALYNQSSTGKTNVDGGAILSLQNAGTVDGSVSIADNARVKLTEVHGGARTFYGTTITGPGALDIGIGTTTFTGGVTLNGATLANSSGGLTVPKGISYVGDVGFYASGGIEFAPDSSTDSGISTTGKMTVRAGWNGGGFGSSTAYALNTGVGTITVSDATVNAASMDWAAGSDITVAGSTVKSSGVMDWNAGGKMEIKGSSTHAALVQAGGNQTLKAASELRVYGGSTISNTGATVESLSGTQTLSANQIRVYGGGVMDNVSTFSLSNNYGRVVANGTQIIEINGSGGELRMDGGYGITSGSGTGNYAEIRQNASSGSQSITFKGTGSGKLTLYGGSYGANNRAEINGGMGNQQIGEHPETSGTYRPSVTLYGGNGGGSVSQGNEASITLADASTKTRYVYANSLSIYGGAAAYGGAGLGGSNQQINLYNTASSLYMKGGSSQNLDEDSVPATAAYIGGKNGANIRITTQGGVDLIGGTGSPVIIGSLSGTATVNIQANGAVNISSDATTNNRGGVFIGSLSALSSSVSSLLLSNDILMSSGVTIRAGQDARVRSYFGKVGLGSLTAYSGAGYGAYITAYGAILDQNGSDTNVTADKIYLTSQYGGSANGIAISVDTNVSKVAGVLKAAVGVDDISAGTPTVVTATPAYGGISVRNTDDSGFGTDTGNIILFKDYASQGGLGSNGRFSVDFRNSGDLRLDRVSVIQIAGTDNLVKVGTDGTLTFGTSANWSALNKVALNAATLTVSDGAYLTTGGDLTVDATTINIDNGYLHAYNGSLKATASGNIRLSGGGSLKSGGDLTVKGADITLTGSGSELVGGINGSGTVNPASKTTVTASGNIRINDGASVQAGGDVYFNLQGSGSSLYVNDQAAGQQSTSTVYGGTGAQGATIHINFPQRKDGGVYIDGSETTDTVAGGSGFYTGIIGSGTVASGSTLSLVYGLSGNSAATAASNTVTSTITNTLNSVTSPNNLGKGGSSGSNGNSGNSVSSGNSGSSGGNGGNGDSFGDNDGKDDKQDSTNNATSKDQNNGQAKPKNQCS